jgi:hypothetical protein
MPQRGVNVLALLKGEERYVFLYDDQSINQVLQTLGRYAADPELSFSWYDAAILSQRVRQLSAAIEAKDDSPAAAVEDPPTNRIGRSAA